MKPEYCLITGASGFLASYLASVCREAGWATHGADRTGSSQTSNWDGFHTGLTGTLDWDTILATPPRFCFHLAGGASVPASVADPIGDFESLFPGTARLLVSIARRAPDCVFVLFSSAAVYGVPPTLPVREDCPIRPVSPYGVHKAMAEGLVAEYARLYGLRAVVLRIFSAYGEGLRKQLFWDLCQKAVAARPGGMIELSGTGAETRDFVHARDVAEAALAAALAASPVPGCEPINVASGIETTVADAASTLLEALRRPVALRFNGESRQGDPPRWVANISRLQRKGFEPKRALSDGVAAYARWFLSLPEERRA
jgi:UDP-glucose 4-epimerase